MKRVTLAEIENMRTRGYDRSTIADAEAWLEVCKRADELIAQVDLAFDGVTLGNGIGLWQSDGIDDYRGPAELQRLRANDEKLDWRRIPVDALNYCNAASAFLDAEGMRFHTPAFIIAELSGQFGADFIDRLIYNSLGAPDFINLLTPAQRHAIQKLKELNGIPIYVHGYGIELKIGELTIDFDWGPNDAAKPFSRRGT